MARIEHITERILADGRRLLVLTEAEGLHAHMTVIVVEGRVRILSDSPPTPTTPVAPPSAPADLPPVQAAILAALNDRPVSAKVLARRSRRRFNSYWREALRALVAARLALRSSDGYTLP